MHFDAAARLAGASTPLRRRTTRSRRNHATAHVQPAWHDTVTPQRKSIIVNPNQLTALKFSLALFLVSAAGCSSAPALSPDHIYAQVVSLVAYDKRLHPVDLTVIDLTALPQETAHADSLDQPGYLESHALKCIGADETASMKRAIRTLCVHRGGEYQVRPPLGVCALDKDGDHPLFVMLALPRSQTCFDITMIEPRGNTASPAYVNELARNGFVTEAARQEQAKHTADFNQRLQEESAQQREAELIRQAAELPRLHEIGARACKVDGELTYLAYVEEFTDQRLKLLVSAAFATRSRLPMPFHQQIMWSTPDQWHPC